MSIDLNKCLENWKSFCDSEEGKKSINDWFAKEKNNKKTWESQLERFDSKFRDNLDFIIEKIINKYESKKYRDREYGMGFEPRSELYWLLFDYAKKHCAECMDEKYLNMFTSKAYYIGSYVIQVMNGQGSVIRIDKWK